MVQGRVFIRECTGAQCVHMCCVVQLEENVNTVKCLEYMIHRKRDELVIQSLRWDTCQ